MVPALKDPPEKLILGRAGWLRRDSQALQGPLTFSELCFTCKKIRDSHVDLRVIVFLNMKGIISFPNFFVHSVSVH